MRTVGEVAELANVSVRTLHHYDDVGLVEPTARTDAGYRLYDEHALERLQTVLFYRELGFGLEEIGEVLGEGGWDRGRALREQRQLLAAEVARLERMIRAIDDAIEAHREGTRMSDETMFEVFGEQQRERLQEAEHRWGGTEAWEQSRRRSADHTVEDWEEIRAEGERIMERTAAVYRDGAAPDSEPAMDAVEAHRRQITDRFYDCSHEMQVRLGEMYVADERFRATYEQLADGLAGWVRDAIRANARRAGVDPASVS